MVRSVYTLFLAVSLLGCDEDPCAQGSMLETAGGLLVTQSEHPTGWGEAECTECHAIPQLHRRACTPEVDLADVRRIVDADGVASCMGCHGENGTEAR